MSKRSVIICGILLLTLIVLLSVPVVPSEIRKNISLDTYQAAEDGDAQAQFAVANAYWNRLEDQKTAVEWYERAAKQDHVEAAYTLARIYHTYDKNGFIPSAEKAYPYYKLAATLNHAISYSYIAELYLEGQVVEKNEDLALGYMKKSADMGTIYAMNWVADYYMSKLDSMYKGNNTPYIKLIQQYSLQAAQSDINAQIRLAKVGLTSMRRTPSKDCDAVIWSELAMLNSTGKNDELNEIKNQAYNNTDKTHLYACYYEIYRNIISGKYIFKPNPEYEQEWIKKAYDESKKYASPSEFAIIKNAYTQKEPS